MTLYIFLRVFLISILTYADDQNVYYIREFTTKPSIQEPVASGNFKIVIWFRIMNQYDNDQLMLEIIGEGEMDKLSQPIMRFEFHRLGHRLSVSFDKEVKSIDYSEYFWTQLSIENQQNNIYDQFTIAIKSNSLSSTISRQQLRNSFSHLYLNFFEGDIQYTQIQITANLLIPLCQPGCDKCDDGAFQCQVCSNQLIQSKFNGYCDCPSSWIQVSQSQCLKNKLVLYERINQQVLMPNFLALFEDNHCVSSALIARLSQYELDSIYNSMKQQLELIYLQIEDQRTLEWYYKAQTSIKWGQSLIFSLNLQHQIYQMTFNSNHYQVQNQSIIYNHGGCVAVSNLKLTVISLYVVEQIITQTLFFQNYTSLRIIDFNIQNTIINNSTLFNSETIVIDGFFMINCTVNYSVILIGQFVEMRNLQIRNSSFLNSSFISCKVQTLLILNLFSENIFMVGNFYFIKIPEVQSLNFTGIYAYDSIFQAGFIKISGIYITLTNITFKNINQKFNYQLLAIMNIYAQNSSIVNLMFDTVQGTYLNPIFCILTEHAQSSFKILNLTIRSFEVQLLKLNNLVYIIQPHQGYTSIQNLIFDNVTLVQQDAMFHILTNEFHLSNGSIVLTDSQPGFTIEAQNIVIQNIVFRFIQQDSNSDYFMVLKANFIKIVQCRFLQSSSSLMLVSLFKPQTASEFIFSDSEVQNQQIAGAKRYYIQLEKVDSVYIQRSRFYGPIQRMPSLFYIIGTQNAFVSDCIINYITNFISIEQRDQSSEIIFNNLKIDNICIKQDKNSFTYALLRVFQGKVKIEDFQISKACNPIELNQITSLAINGYRAKQIKVYSALISILSRQNLSITITNAFFKRMTIKSALLDGLIFIQNKNTINLTIDSIYFNEISSDTDHQALIGIFSQNLHATINQLIILDCSCSHQCISIYNEIGVLIIDNSTFIRNSVNEFFSISNSANHVLINNSLFMWNRLQGISDINSIVIANCEFLYNELYQNIDTEKFKSSNRILDYPTDIQVMLSLNGGLQSSINQRLSNNNFEIKLKNGNSVTNQFYIPTGQPFNDFILFDQKACTYKQQQINMHYSIKNVSDNAQCSFLYMNTSLEFQLLYQNWDKFLIISKPNTIIKFEVKCTVLGVNHSLVFYGKIMECQLGEFIYINKCIRCLPDLYQYSVQKQSQFCKPIDVRTMREVKYALLNLYEGYWRPILYNDWIESCIQSQNSCNGGFKVGNQLCQVGFLGAICADCDSNNQLGEGMFIKNSLNKCQLCNFLWSDIIKFFFHALLSAYFIFSNTKLFYDILRQRKIDLLVKKKTYRFTQPSERTGIYIQFLLQYFQSITNTNSYSIVSLIPFQFRPNIFDNASFSYMNYVDCFISNYFSQELWLYVRQFFLLMCYLLILYLYFILYFIMLKVSNIKYQFFMIFIPIVNIYQNNIVSYLSQIFLLLIPIEYSNLTFIQSRMSLRYFTYDHLQGLAYFIIPQFSIIILLPIIQLISFQKMETHHSTKVKSVSAFKYLLYSYKENSFLSIYFIKLYSILIIVIVYTLQRQNNVRIIILMATAQVFYLIFQHYQPYQLYRFNNLRIKIQLMFFSQLIIMGIAENQGLFVFQYILQLIYYLIFGIVVIIIAKDLIPELDLDNMHWTDKLRGVLKMELRADKIKSIRKLFIQAHRSISLQLIHTKHLRTEESYVERQ